MKRLLQVLGALFVVAVPLLGAWVASSLAAYANGPRWLAAAAGLLLFPVLPLAWEAWANTRRRRRDPPRPPRLRLRTRLVLRTLALSVAVLAGVLVLRPKMTFTALSTRGDWMLEGRAEPWALTSRDVLFAIADQLEWVYLAVQDNPFERYADDDDRVDPVVTVVPTSTTVIAAATKTEVKTATGALARVDPETGVTEYVLHETRPPGETEPVRPAPDPAKPRVEVTAAGAQGVWPQPVKLHSVIESMPQSVETSLESVARYIATNERDPLQRTKAIHDYVADRIAYDAEAFAAGRYPPQDEKTVFETRRAVCAGYARLFTAMMRAAGEEAISISGQARTLNGGVGGGGHAWNAVKLGGAWYLVDVTWDSGRVSGSTFTKRYSTAYFLTPPEIFGLSHHPDKPKWQLLASPLSMGDFMRQPMLTPYFYAQRLELVSPARSQITAKGGDVELVLANPADVSLMATFAKAEASISGGEHCEITHGNADARVRCRFPDAGTYKVAFFVSEDQLGGHEYVGHLEVQNPG